jgi:hypothetical protein
MDARELDVDADELKKGGRHVEPKTDERADQGMQDCNGRSAT